jgi:hypothetical protein
MAVVDARPVYNNSQLLADHRYIHYTTKAISHCKAIKMAKVVKHLELLTCWH